MSKQPSDLVLQLARLDNLQFKQRKEAIKALENQGYEIDWPDECYRAKRDGGSWQPKPRKCTRCTAIQPL